MNNDNWATKPSILFPTKTNKSECSHGIKMDKDCKTCPHGTRC